MAKLRKGYLIRRGKTYYAAWYVGNKQFVKTTAQTDRKEAEKELAKMMQPYLVSDEVRTLETVKARIEGAKSELISLDEAKNPPLVIADAWTAFERSPERPDSGDATLRQYRSEFRRFETWIAKAHPEIKTLRDVSEAHANAYAKDLAEAKASASTFNQHVGFLRLLWRVLRKEAQHTTNPWDVIRRRRLTMAARRELTVDELRRVCANAEGEMRLLFALGIYTGLRLGDCATLRWGEVDLVRNVIRRIPMKIARRKKTPIHIPIHAVLSALLSEVPQRQRRNDVLPELAQMYRCDSAALSKRIQAHFEASEISTHSDSTEERIKAAVDVGFHSLRHTFVSLCREANAPLAVVEAIVGHSSPAMTRHYTHVSDHAAGMAVALLPSVIGDSEPTVKKKAPSKTVIAARLKSMTAENWTAVRDELLAALT